MSVYAPRNATNLPVLVWIHGGGYGQGRGSEDMSAIINANGNKFVAVAIQYRVSFPMARRCRSFEHNVETDGVGSWVLSASCPRMRSCGMESSMRDCSIRRSHCSGFRATLGSLAATLRMLLSAARALEPDQSCCSPWLSEAISAIRSSAMSVTVENYQFLAI